MRVIEAGRRPGRPALGGSGALRGCVLATMLALACDAGDGASHRPPTGPSPTAVPRVGTIQVRTVTTGDPLDVDGYLVYVGSVWDYGQAPYTRVDANGAVEFTGIMAGPQLLQLEELAPNCRGEDLADRRVTVVADVITPVTFHVVCTAP